MDHKQSLENVFIHKSAWVDSPVKIGDGTKIWHFTHVSSGASIGENCTLGQNVFIGNNVKVGKSVKVQNNVSVYTGCELEDEVFLGPGCVLTNVINPRSQVNRQRLYEKTLFKRGATIGANATIVCGITVGRYAFVGAGSVITRNVPDYALMMGNPARKKGWMSRHGHVLETKDEEGFWICPESGFRYEEKKGMLRCIDLDEEAALPEELSVGSHSYRTYKKKRNS